MNNNENNICSGCGRHCHLTMPGCGRGEDIARSMGITPEESSAHRPAPPPRRQRSEATDINERLALNFRDIGHAQKALRHSGQENAGDAQLFSCLSESEKQTLLPLLERINSELETRFGSLLEAPPPHHPHGHGGPHGRF